MRKIKVIILFLFCNFFIIQSVNSLENYIVFKVNNNIITKVDIDKEYKYLIALNKDLKKLEKKKVVSLASDSIIREKIKEIEIQKYIDIESMENEYNEDLFKGFYNNLGFETKNNFEQYLLNNDLDYEYVKKKIFIEISWNNLIYEKYINDISIDVNLIKSRLIKENNNQKDIMLYSLSEIYFQVENEESLVNKYEEIKSNIEVLGFEGAANIYSISDSSKVGGKLGWIQLNQVSKNLKEKIKSLAVQHHTEPITVPGGFIIIKLNDKKTTKKTNIVNLDDALKEAIQLEKNKQLDKFSKIYFSRIKKNSYISK